MVGTGTTGQWAVASWLVIQAGNVWREDLDNRMPTGLVNRDYVDGYTHGLIASANMSNVNIWGWLLLAR